MNLGGHRFSQDASQELQGLLPYPLTTYRAEILEILVIFGWHFGRIGELMNAF